MNFISQLPLFISLFCFCLLSASKIALAESELGNLTNIKNRDIETNFLWIKLHEFQFSHPKSQILVSSDPVSSIIYAAARGLEEISIISFKKTSQEEFILNKNKVVKIPKTDPNLENTFILDIKFSEKKLYSTVFRYSDKDKSCSFVELLESDKELSYFKRIFKSSPCLANPSDLINISGRIAVDKSNIYVAGGNMLMDIGNTSFPRSSYEFCCPENNYLNTMKKTNFFGSVILINKKTHAYKKISNGHRSPGGLFYDEYRKVLWESEHGPRGGDEINKINLHKVQDYGYPFVSLGSPYRKDSANLGTKFNSHEKFTSPFFAFLPSIGPSQFALPPKNEPFNNLWGSDLLLTSLKDRSIFRIKIFDDRAIYLEKMYIGNRLRSIDTLKENIIMGTDNGSVLVLESNKTEPVGTYPTNDYDFPSCAFNGKDKSCVPKKKHNWISSLFTS